MNFKNHSTKPSAKISTLQLSAYGADGFVGFKLDTLNNMLIRMFPYFFLSLSSKHKL